MILHNVGYAIEEQRGDEICMSIRFAHTCKMILIFSAYHTDNVFITPLIIYVGREWFSLLLITNLLTSVKSINL